MERMSVRGSVFVSTVWKWHDRTSQNKLWEFHSSSLVIYCEENHPGALPGTFTKPHLNHLDPSLHHGAGASKVDSSIIISAVSCFKLLCANDSRICLPPSAQQSQVGPDSLPRLPDGTWVDGCIFRLDTSQQRSFSPTPTCQQPWDLFMPLLALAVHHFRLS